MSSCNFKLTVVTETNFTKLVLFWALHWSELCCSGTKSKGGVDLCHFYTFYKINSFPITIANEIPCKNSIVILYKVAAVVNAFHCFIAMSYVIYGQCEYIIKIYNIIH